MKQTTQLALLIFLLTLSAVAQNTQRIKDLNVDSGALALGGYDAVAYLKDKKAIKGKENITAVIGGVKYRFSSIANKNSFDASPATYEPQYGGWCAYAMGENGEKVEVDPETFKIVDGKLYLFYNKFFNNTLATWNKNERNLKAQADKNWNKLVKP